MTLRELIADGDRTVMRYHWEAEVAADGLGVPPGSTLEVEVAQFLTVRGGKVVQSIEYLSRVRRP